MSDVKEYDPLAVEGVEIIEVPRHVLAAVFDALVTSMDFGSGFMEDEDVEALRTVAVLLGTDPQEATPYGYRCKYSGTHEPHPFDPSLCRECKKPIPNAPPRPLPAIPCTCNDPYCDAMVKATVKR